MFDVLFKPALQRTALDDLLVGIYAVLFVFLAVVLLIVVIEIGDAFRRLVDKVKQDGGRWFHWKSKR